MRIFSLSVFFHKSPNEREDDDDGERTRHWEKSAIIYDSFIQKAQAGEQKKSSFIPSHQNGL